MQLWRCSFFQITLGFLVLLKCSCRFEWYIVWFWLMPVALLFICKSYFKISAVFFPKIFQWHWLCGVFPQYKPRNWREKCLKNDLFYVEWTLNLCSISQFSHIIWLHWLFVQWWTLTFPTFTAALSTMTFTIVVNNCYSKLCRKILFTQKCS